MSTDRVVTTSTDASAIALRSSASARTKRHRSSRSSSVARRRHSSSRSAEMSLKTTCPPGPTRSSAAKPLSPPPVALGDDGAVEHPVAVLGEQRGTTLPYLRIARVPAVQHPACPPVLL